ncbi:MAG: type I restriction-modification system subunit M N-terminal domain-containing protein [Chordicoccus sp.]
MAGAGIRGYGSKYGLVILPMAVIKRFHDCLMPTHQKVLDTYKKVEKLAVKDGFLRSASGYQFYNISPFTFETLKADPENIEAIISMCWDTRSWNRSRLSR